ncbi:MAG: VWA domain-containing protein [Nitrospirae bacterium YQR-1]
MLTKIKHWCDTPSQYEKPVSIVPPSILALLLDNENDMEDKFVLAAMEKLHPAVKNLEVPFNPPVFPFDNNDFQDPFYLVHTDTQAAIDLGNIKSMDDTEAEAFLKEIYGRFTFLSNGKVRVKKRDLINFAGKSYYFDTIKKSGHKASKEDAAEKRKKDFLAGKTSLLSDIHMPSTIVKGVIRRVVTGALTLIEKDDLMSCRRQAGERANILIAIDSSTSMEQYGKLEYAAMASLSFHYYKSTHYRESKVKFVAFNENIQETDPLDILGIKAGGMTHTAELLEFVYHYFSGKNKGENPELYIITDGYPQKSGISDTVYQSRTLKAAQRLKTLKIRTKILLVYTEDSTLNDSVVRYNKLISDALSGELIKIGPRDISQTLIKSDSSNSNSKVNASLLF